MYENSQLATKEQLFSAFQKLQPTITLNQVIGSPQLFSMINQLSLSASNMNYDDQTYEELIERVGQLFGNLTISNFLDVHIQAVDILSFRIDQSRMNQVALQEFIAQLHTRVNELTSQSQSQFQSTQQDSGMQVTFKQFTIQSPVHSNSLQLRIFNEPMNIDQVLSFQNNGAAKIIKLENQSASIDSLLHTFQVEVFDNQRNFGFATLNVYQLNLKFPKKILLPLSLDSMNTGINLEIEGNVMIQNLKFAQEDLESLKQALSQLNDDIVGLDDQFRGLTVPFSSQVRQQQQQKPPVAQEMIQNSYRQQPAYENQQAAVGYGYDQPQNNYSSKVSNQQQLQHRADLNEDCEISTQTLVQQIHKFLIVYLLIAVLFCVKRQVFFDVTIAISFLAVLYKMNLSADHRGPLLLKLFSFFFIFSALMDLAWLIVFFPSWNRDATSEDQGAQSLLRILILGGSLLFMVYKILMIVAVIYLQSSIVSTGALVKQTIHQFLDGENHQQQAGVITAPAGAQNMNSQLRTSHNPAFY